MNTDGVSNQLRWVMLLLAAAVILPTACLLWFMTQAMKNERFAVRQKLIDFYTERAERFFVELPDGYIAMHFIEPVDTLAADPSYQQTPGNLFLVFASEPEALYQGMLIYDADGRLVYPILNGDIDTDSEPLAESLRLEQAGDYEQALAAYRQVTQQAQDEAVRLRAQLAMARCLEKLGRLPEAIELAAAASHPGELNPDSPQAILAIHAQVYLAELYQGTGDERLLAHLRRTLNNDGCPAPALIWQLDRLVDMARQAGLANQLEMEIKRAQNRVAAYENAFQAADQFPTAPADSQWPDRTIRRLRPDGDLFGIKFQAAGRTVMGVAPADDMLAILKAAAEDVQDELAAVRVVDNFGQAIAGDAKTQGPAFLEVTPGRFFPEFRAAVAFRGDGVLDTAAGRQTTVYLWTGALGIGLVLLTGTAAIQTVSRQARMNRLKNDFIATVTHELKTPLSSMRLLVDTLREGRVESEDTAAEYLDLIAGENKRLTHLIDNFLTFSRMERGKQVFDLRPVEPADAAAAAAEAMRAKFAASKCEFTCTVEENLPSVRADRDALVTVLVNLLENACKYTGNDKQIALRAFHRNGVVCFAVEDNGIGISPRAKKRIFERFYQADRRLSRSAEGCGLGLSIVKYIVDAHKGTIDVESKPGKGSTFTVRLAALQE